MGCGGSRGAQHQQSAQTLCSEPETRPEGLSSYQHGGGDGEGTGSDARDEVQQVISWNGTRGVREIPHGLQSQEGEAWCSPAGSLPALRVPEAVPRSCATLPWAKGTTLGTSEHQPPCPIALCPPEQHRAHPRAQKDPEPVLTASGNPQTLQKVGEID